MKYFSTFSGIGGFELGIQQAYETNIYNRNGGSKTKDQTAPIKGMEKREQSLGGLGNNANSNNRSSPVCVGYSEIDKYAIEVYQKHFNHKNYGDITQIKPEVLPDFEMLVGGFPCQSFSIAGPRTGFEDTRGTMFFEIARIVKQKQPRLLLLENVKGLLSHDKGATFYTIISTLDELGYDCQWQVLNSKNHGVPQNRERVFIIGHLRGTSRPEVFPFGEGREKIKGDRKGKVSGTVIALYGKQPTDGTYIQSRPHGFNKGGKRKYPNVRSSTPHNEILNGIRRLTPTECERLQGFPDGWTIAGTHYEEDELGKIIGQTKEERQISDTQRYKMLGNAVTVNVIKDIVEKLYTPPSL